MMTAWWPRTPLQLPPILPEGFALPSLLYLGPLLVALLGIGILLYTFRPPVTDYTLLALAPWIATGSALHVLYQQPAFFDVVRPLFGNPTVYLTTAVVTGATWTLSELIAEMRPPGASIDRQLGVVGGTVLVVTVAYSLWVGSAVGTLQPLWPVLGITLSAMGTGFAWIALSLTFTDAAAVTGRTGAVVLFGHVLDGVSTAIGIDILGVDERTPFAELILNYSAQLPTAEVIGVGWLFLLIKLLLALFVLVAFREYVEEDPEQARLVLVVVAALGLGPGAHNMLLFTVIESAGVGI